MLGGAVFTVGMIEKMDVYNDSDKKIGSVEQIRVNAATQKMAELSVGGFLGIGEHHVLVPLERFQVHDDRLILTGGTAEQLKSLPAYDAKKDAMGYNEADNKMPIPVGAMASNMAASGSAMR
jgi:sporulation protein YlmC with PRC-barrel domain